MLPQWELLNHLHRGGAWGYWWTPGGHQFIGDDGQEHRAKLSQWYPIGRRCAPPAAWADKNVYWCVHPCTGIPPTNSRGQERKPHQVRGQLGYIAAVNCLFAEYDGGGDAALARLESLPYYPSAVIHSGGGLHCYWLLEYTHPVTADNRAALAWLQAKWVDLVGGDDGAKDLARVLRVPGWQNRKPERRLTDGSFPTVTMLEFNAGRMYDLARLAALLPPYRPPDPKPTSVGPAGAPGETPSGGGDVDDDENDGGARAVRWAYANISKGSRHARARWLACALREKGVSELAAKTELERFQEAANKAGGRQLDDDEMAGIVAWAYGQGARGVKINEYAAALAGLNGEAVATVRGDAAMLANWQQAGENVGVVWAALREAGHDEATITQLQQTVRRAIPPWWAEFQPDEKGQSDAFLHRHGEEWAYVTGLERWFKWVGTHWQEDETRLFRGMLQRMLDDVHQEAMEAARDLQREADALAATADPMLGDDDDTKAARAAAKEAWARALAWRRTARRMDAIGEHCKDSRPVRHDRMNAGNLLNLANGTLDLTSYTLRPHDRDDMLTHCLPYAFDPAATCPRWLQFMSEVLVKEDRRTPDPELIAVFQEALGYALTNETRHEAMFWLCGVNAATNSAGALQTGNAQNGKSTTLNVIEKMLADLAMPFSPESLTRPDASYYLAGFAGKRVVIARESKGGAKVAAELLKPLVSGETIQARPIRGDPITIKPMCKIFWAMNDKPRVDDNTDGFWRRLIVIPFARQFTEEEKDVHLSEKLLAELPGIVAWAIEGLRRLRANGRFTAAAAVKAAVGEYRTNQNAVALWLNECTTYALPEADRPTTTTPARDAFSDYLRWAKESNRQHTLTSTAFGTELSRLVLKTKNSVGAMVYHFGLTTPAVEDGAHWAER